MKGGHFLETKHFEYHEPYVILKNVVLARNFSNPATLRGDMEQKLHFEDNIGVWVLKMLNPKNDPLLSWNFSNSTTRKGDMGSEGALNICLKKQPPLS